ncbi:NUDIX family hydrolase [Histoplasma capsulatum G186AR]|uniref:NUDIX family hydrolase n=1 Tax=Ajellomyces capsulatus (strain G186AR / H82 / ATCC MYA-2454 / RMSCC 2432) TaxID=447093 RepID=C0NBC9_AJECG|nr:NUDIX family hydrolase [Histoplasma capsulatum G186AR]EEH10970.1 NUDIX family hydrolase [Histoplasma capsulatum G186AR]
MMLPSLCCQFPWNANQLRTALRLTLNGSRFPCPAANKCTSVSNYLYLQVTRRFSQEAHYSIARRVPQYRRMAPPKETEVDHTIPKPSASVILISPRNEVLLLHRVQTSSSFPSAHVFPGGNISSQDGDFPQAGHSDSHDEGPHYRRAAIRELFEESGILLAKNRRTGKMIYVDADQREIGRHAIHKNKITFNQWLAGIDEDAQPDIDPLIPFTHWITPTTNHRRYTTQMYLYFLPLSPESKSIIGSKESDVQAPTSDGGLEITEASFLPASEWLRLAKNGDVIMFPPQVFLLSFVAQFLERPGESATAVSKEGSTRRRAELVEFVHSGSPPWTDKFISPTTIGHATDGRSILRLDYVGPELQGSAKKGEPDRVVLVRFCKEGPREVEVRWRNEVVLGKKPAQSSL